MTAPSLNVMTGCQAERKLQELGNSVEGSLEDSGERACSYNLTPREFAVRERIFKLRWLLGRD